MTEIEELAGELLEDALNRHDAEGVHRLHEIKRLALVTKYEMIIVKGKDRTE
jgi:hypothetical protein